jgi:hypothetical protein
MPIDMPWRTLDERRRDVNVRAIRTTHISFGPQALIVSVGYSFQPP